MPMVCLLLWDLSNLVDWFVIKTPTWALDLMSTDSLGNLFYHILGFCIHGLCSSSGPPWSIFAFTCGHCIKQAHQRLNRVSCLPRRLKLLYSLNLFARQMDFQRCLYQYQLFACIRLTSPKFKQPSGSLFHEFCCNDLGLWTLEF